LAESPGFGLAWRGIGMVGYEVTFGDFEDRTFRFVAARRGLRPGGIPAPDERR